MEKTGVSKGARTLNPRIHSPVLYRLSYTHRKYVLARPEGIEPPTCGFEGRRASYQGASREWSSFIEKSQCGCAPWNPLALRRSLIRLRLRAMRLGAPGGNRTPDLRLRRPTLYPTELRAHTAGDRRVKRSAVPAIPCCQRSGRRDSDPRPPAPKAGALPGCATPRTLEEARGRPFPRTPVCSLSPCWRQAPSRAIRSSTGRSFRNASPRCESASFSSGESSAMVRPSCADGTKSGS